MVKDERLAAGLANRTYVLLLIKSTLRFDIYENLFQKLRIGGGRRA
jgi:hypothetical protein